MAKQVVYLEHISVLETSAAYRREVERYLDLMASTLAGKTLMKFVNKTGHAIVIQPFKPSKDDSVNAYASPDSTQDAYALDYKIMGEKTLPDGSKVKALWKKGTGKGTDTHIDYHPATWRQLEKNAGRIQTGAGPAEILFHEMVHAYRMQLGLMRDDKVWGFPHFDNVEEFYAILAANVYRSERGFTHIRMDHWGFSGWDGSSFHRSLSNPSVFYDVFSDEIDEWFDEDRAFCLAMTDVRAKFNPFQYAAVSLGLRATTGHAMELPA